MGFENEEAWLLEYEQARERVHAIYRRYSAR
jgi:hypothetical protein